MDLKNYADSVHKWLELAGKQRDVNRKQSLDTCISLILEEQEETRKAVVESNRVEILDGLVDQFWVWHNASYYLDLDIEYLSLGYRVSKEDLQEIDQYSLVELFAHDTLESVQEIAIKRRLNRILFLAEHAYFFTRKQIKQAFDTVEKSNYSKFCKNIEEAQATEAMYETKGIEVEIRPVDCYFIILRKEDGKILKNINYKPANIRL